MLQREFYARDAVEVAQDLLGCVLVHDGVSGRIVETEAYLGARDAASHAYRGQTPRTAVMFGPAGHAYIYFTYGMHYCFNVVTGEESDAQAVLLRALEPLVGIEQMEERRLQSDLRNLCSGPAKLVQALGITKDLNNHDLTRPPLYIEAGESAPAEQVVTTTRVGISQAADAPLRFYIGGNPFVSKP